MNTIPLVTGNTPQEINTSIIALKKALNELESREVTVEEKESSGGGEIPEDIEQQIQAINEDLTYLNYLLNQEAAARRQAIEALDYPLAGGSGKYIQSISETNGVIAADTGNITTTVTSGSNDLITSGGVASALYDYVQTSDITDTVTSGSTAPVSSGGVYNAFSGHFLSLENPINKVTYAKIGIKNYDKKIHSVFIAFNCYTCWGVIREQNQCFYKGTLYGIRGVSYTGYSTDNNDYFWIKYSNYRSIDFVSSRELYVIEKTTTEPSGVSFIAPVSWDNNTRGEKSEEPIDEEKENER